PELGAHTQSALHAVAPAHGAVSNPVDLVASASADLFEQSMAIVLADAAIDIVLVIFVPPLVTRADDVARAIARATTDTDKTVVACFLGHNGVPDALTGAPRPIPSFPFPESAVAALARSADHADWVRRPEGSIPTLRDIASADARRLV